MPGRSRCGTTQIGVGYSLPFRPQPQISQIKWHPEWTVGWQPSAPMRVIIHKSLVGKVYTWGASRYYRREISIL